MTVAIVWSHSDCGHSVLGWPGRRQMLWSQPLRGSKELLDQGLVSALKGDSGGSGGERETGSNGCGGDHRHTHTHTHTHAR